MIVFPDPEPGGLGLLGFDEPPQTWQQWSDMLGAIKNLVGINGDKARIPHFRAGGGDGIGMSRVELARPAQRLHVAIGLAEAAGFDR